MKRRNYYRKLVQRFSAKIISENNFHGSDIYSLFKNCPSEPLVTEL
jgi:hypothetical protein